jgi:hypothetical protein
MLVITVIILLAVYVSRHVGDANNCSEITDIEAVSFTERHLQYSYGNNVSTDLGNRSTGDLYPSQVGKDYFGKDSTLNSVNVTFSDRSSHKPIIVMRIFPDCEIEWRPVR